MNIIGTSRSCPPRHLCIPPSPLSPLLYLLLLFKMKSSKVLHFSSSRRAAFFLSPRSFPLTLPPGTRALAARCASCSPRPLAHSPSRSHFSPCTLMVTRPGSPLLVPKVRVKSACWFLESLAHSSLDTTQARGHGSLQSFRYSSSIIVFRSAAEQRYF